MFDFLTTPLTILNLWPVWVGIIIGIAIAVLKKK